MQGSFQASHGLATCSGRDVFSTQVVQRRPAGHRRPPGTVAAAAAAAAAVPAAHRNAAAGRGSWSRAAAAPTSGGSSSADGPQQPAAPTQPAPAAAPPSSSSAAFSFSEPELRQLWDSVTRSLLKLGKAGLSDTHVNSLQELLSSHKLVKVDLNGARDDAQVEAAAAQVAARLGGAGALLQVKGRTLLLANSSSSSEELLALAEASAASTAVWRAKRAVKKAEGAAKRAAA